MKLKQEEYTAWLAAEIQAAIDDPRPSIPHDEVMARMDSRIAALLKKSALKNTPTLLESNAKSLPL